MINVFTFTIDQFNAYMLNKIINFLPRTKHNLNGSVITLKLTIFYVVIKQLNVI